jgi:OFA family oxalate/formate antiporter-like MFS transporter
LYTAKGTAALLVPLGSVMAAAYGSWHAVFVIAAIANFAAAAGAIFVLKPLRAAYTARRATTLGPGTAHSAA